MYCKYKEKVLENALHGFHNKRAIQVCPTGALVLLCLTINVIFFLFSQLKQFKKSETACVYKELFNIFVFCCLYCEE